MEQLLESEDADTREFSAYSLLDLYGVEAETFLKKLNDSVIQQAIEEWKK